MPNRAWFYFIAGWIAAGRCIAAPPPNDDFTNRIALTGLPVVITGSNILATATTGDPIIGGEGAYATVWWSWVAPSNGQYTVVTTMTNAGRPIVDVFTWSPNYWLQGAGGVQDSYQQIAGGSTSRVAAVTFTGASGTEYEIVVDARDGTATYQGVFGLAITVRPTISFLAPAEEQDFTPGTDVNLLSVADDADGGIASVDYSLQFGPELCSATHSPWGCTWAKPSVGRYQVLARATDNLGARTSALREFTVGRPVNDDFTNRIALSGVPALGAGSTSAAGKEPLEPQAIGSYVTYRTIWWSWTAPSNGQYAVVIMSTNAPKVVGVFTGGSVENLMLHAVDSFAYSTLTNSVYCYYSQAKFQGEAGMEYEVVVDGGSRGGDVQLAITVPPQVRFTNPLDRTVLPASQPLPLSAEPSDTDGMVNRVEFYEVYIGPGYGWMDLVGTVTTTPWSTSWANPSTGKYPLCASVTDNLGAQTSVTNLVWVGVAPPINDDLANRIPISNLQTNVSVSGSTVWASGETGEPFGRYSEWWSWIAPVSGPVTIGATSSAFTPVVSVFTGTAISNLTTIGYGVGDPWSFGAVAGTEYAISVDGWEGDVTLTIASPPAPPVRLANYTSGNGTFGFQFSGLPGQKSIVEASSDLLSWTPLTTNVYTGSAIWFEDSGAGNFTRRFYRVRQE